MRTRRTGFTLIELLVVIAIIAILAAILFPIFMRVRAQARLITCTSNMNQLVKGIKAYSVDYGGYNVPGEWDANIADNVLNGWCERIYSYVNEWEAYKCPQTEFWFGYGLNYHCATPLPGRESIFHDPGPGLEGDLNFVENPAKCILLYEKNPEHIDKNVDYSFQLASTDWTNDWQEDGMCTWGQAGVPGFGSRDYWMFFPGPHPGGNEPVGFVDGHVRVFKAWNWNAMTFKAYKK